MLIPAWISNICQNQAYYAKMEEELIHLRGEEHRLHKHIGRLDRLIETKDEVISRQAKYLEDLRTAILNIQATCCEI